MNSGLEPFESGDKVIVNMPGHRDHGQVGRVEGRVRTQVMDLYIVRLNCNIMTKMERRCLRSKSQESPSIDREFVPRDGDHISLHENHEIVTSQAGHETYKYCRTCKVEVKEGGRIMTGSAVKVTFDGKEVKPPGSYGNNHIPTASGKDLDAIAALYNLSRDGVYAVAGIPETDECLRQRIRDRIENMNR